MRILLLEDDVALNKAIRKVLELDNHQVESFIDGNEIIANLDRKYDLYILDINVPHISGLELLEIIMQHNKRSKVIMISSNTDIHSVKAAYTFGCVDYLKKPFYIEELRVKINRLQIPKDDLLSDVKLKEDYESLTKKEKRLLFLLLENQEYVVTYEMIEDFVYESRAMSMDALRALIRRLRMKLSDEIMIRNIIDEGYSISFIKRQQDRTVDVSQKLLTLQKENTLLKLEKELLLKRSITDPLTGLYNRLKIKELFLEEKQYVQNKENSLSLILMDLDDFKAVNDCYGHNAGDRYLKMLAATLKEFLRPEDIIGRWGGEEFIVLLPKTPLEEARDIAQYLREKIPEIDCPIIGARTASFGLAELRVGDTLETIIQHADEALFQAKEQGKNRVKIFLK
jgi:diguanylate cyclase (GGDEF)-like protein